MLCNDGGGGRRELAVGACRWLGGARGCFGVDSRIRLLRRWRAWTRASGGGRSGGGGRCGEDARSGDEAGRSRRGCAHEGRTTMAAADGGVNRARADGVWTRQTEGEWPTCWPLEVLATGNSWRLGAVANVGERCVIGSSRRRGHCLCRRAACERRRCEEEVPVDVFWPWRTLCAGVKRLGTCERAEAGAGSSVVAASRSCCVARRRKPEGADGSSMVIFRGDGADEGDRVL